MSAQKKFLIDTVFDVFGGEGETGLDLSDSSSVFAQLHKNKAVDRFIHDPDTALLQVALLKGDSELKISNQVLTSPGIKSEVHIVKKSRGALPEMDISQHILVNTMLESPLWSLYLSLHNVFGPKLAQ